MYFEQQDIETPIELLSKRFKYHKDMMNNFKEGTEKLEHHTKMMIKFMNAVSYLEDRDGEK